MARSYMLPVLLALIVSTPTYAEGGVPPELKVVNLAADRSLDVRIQPAQPTVGDVLAAIEAKTHRPLIALGPIALPGDEIVNLQGAQAREALLVLARGMKSEWREYEKFYLLFPKQMTRHTAAPHLDLERQPQLKRKLGRGIYERNLGMGLRRAGQEARVSLRLGGFRVPPPVLVRSTWPCAIFADGSMIGDVMRAFTAMLGDPWDREGTTQILCCTGELLTAEDRQDLDHVLALDQFGEALSPEQSHLMASEQGLGSDRMSASQRRDLARAVAPIFTSKGIVSDSIVLRRLPSAGGGFSPNVNVYVPGATGSILVGSLSLPD